jgi:hypothetical protein
MWAQQFAIHIRSNSSTPEERKRAMEASVEELKKHPLTKLQKEMVQQCGITEDQYARSELARIYGRRRLESVGQGLGSIVQGLLAEIGEEYHLQALLYEDAKFQWIARVKSAQGTRDFSIQRELFDVTVDSARHESIQELKRRLVEGLGKVVIN